MVNCFSRIRHRTDNMESDHFYGPRRNGRSHPHISWSNPIVNQPLAPDWEPFIPPNPFSSYEPMNFERASPHHRIAQPPRGILRGAQQSRPFDGFGSPNSNQFATGTPRLHRRSSMPFQRGRWGQNDSPFQRRNSIRHTPIQSYNTPLQSLYVPPPPTPARPAFDEQQSNGYSFQPMQTQTGTPGRAVPQLAQETPFLTQWNFPSGTLAWSPHPAPHPNVPASAFWTGNTGLQGLPPATPGRASNTPLDAWQATLLTGGWPLPGSDPRWTPGTWPPVAWGTPVPVRLAPCLIPNPANPNMPQLVWDISQNPATAQRITGAHTIIPLSSQFQEQAILPATGEVRIAVQSTFIERLWGSISVNTESHLTVWDILSGIYEFFQIQLTQTEVGYIQSLDQRNYDILVKACHARCNVTPALPGFERTQGLKRIDILGDQRGFWGLWIKFDDLSNCWHLNLGLVNLRPGW